MGLFDFTGRRFRKERATIECLLQASRVHEARLAHARAIERWQFNWENGGQQANLRDLSHLRWLLSTAGDVLPAEARPRCEHAEQAAAKVYELMEDRGSYWGMGTRMLTKPAALLHIELMRRLEQDRKTIVAALRGAAQVEK